MKTDTQDRAVLMPREEGAILDEIRGDHDLIRRLSITPQELEALSKCALLGTLTCKQDMLFILRQIREAASSSIDHTMLFPQPVVHDEVQVEQPAPDFRRIPGRITPPSATGPASLAGITRRRLPKLGIVFWMLVLVGGLVWNAYIMMSRWHNNFLSTIGASFDLTPASDRWYLRVDNFNVLLFWEALFVASVALVMYLRSRPRTKFRSGKRSR